MCFIRCQATNSMEPVMKRARERSDEVRQDTQGPELPLDAEAELRTLSTTTTTCDDGPEFSSEPMPAAFPAFVFLGLGLLICVLLAFLL
jgi:hypothetical protein